MPVQRPQCEDIYPLKGTVLQLVTLATALSVTTTLVLEKTQKDTEISQSFAKDEITTTNTSNSVHVSTHDCILPLSMQIV
jgi:hypothetical protein